MVMLTKLGLLSDKTLAFEEAFGVLQALAVELDETSPTDHNQAKQLAGALLGRLIVIYAAGVFRGVARRWKTQLNENSKVTAFYDTLPEAHHNSITGYSLPARLMRQATFLLLEPRSLHPRTLLRYQITRELLDRESIPHHTPELPGISAPSQILSAVLLGDYTSYYLALLQGVDPAPVANIDYVKGRLASQA
jgi:glucose/mannose-6-phosphate isomerase